MSRALVVTVLLLQVSGREVFEFNPTLVMEGDDDDDGGEVFVHHYNKVIISIEGNNYYNNLMHNICDWLWENLPLTHKDKYLEIRNSIIQSVICREGLKLHAYNSLQIYSYLIAIRLYTHSTMHS